MPYQLLADIVLLIHAAFIVFACAGGLLVLRWRLVMWLHLPAVVWVILLELLGWICPLTPLENKYRSRAGQAGYETGFVEHYIAPLVYPEGLTHEMGLVVGTSVLVWNILIYSFICYRLSARKRNN